MHESHGYYLFMHYGYVVNTIGGDVDGASKTLIGVAMDPEQFERTAFLIAVSN